MAQIIEGDGRGLHRGLIGNTPGLPPRFPTLSNRGVLLADLDTFSQGSYGSCGGLGRSYRQHKDTPSYHVVVQDQPFVYGKLVEESGVSMHKASHRRSASDSFTYFEEKDNLSMFGNVAEEGESEWQTSKTPHKVANEAKEDGDQLTNLLEEIQHLQDQQNLPISARSQAVHFNLDSSVVSETSCASASLEATPGNLSLDGKGTELEEVEFYCHDSNNGDVLTLAECSENDLNPKMVKRVLANRQSAQRSRVRKLQYIAELERIVGTLQMEVSTLSLEVIYLKHQRAVLNMDNNALKQQVVFFLQEKRSKDSQNESLKHDIRRLKKLSEFQSFHKSLQMQKQQQPQHRHIQRHSSLPTDLIAKMYQPGELNMGSQLYKTEASSADGLTRLMRDFGGMSLDTALSQEKLHRNMDCHVAAGAVPTTELNRAVNRQSSDGEVLAVGTLHQ